MTRCGLLWRWGEEGGHLPRFTRRLPRGPERRPRYGIELGLNHQASDLTTMLMAIDRDDPHWNFGYRADYELRDLRCARAVEHRPRLSPEVSVRLPACIPPNACDAEGDEQGGDG